MKLFFDFIRPVLAGFRIAHLIFLAEAFVFAPGDIVIVENSDVPDLMQLSQVALNLPEVR